MLFFWRRAREVLPISAQMPMPYVYHLYSFVLSGSCLCLHSEVSLRLLKARCIRRQDEFRIEKFQRTLMIRTCYVFICEIDSAKFIPTQLGSFSIAFTPKLRAHNWQAGFSQCLVVLVACYKVLGVCYQKNRQSSRLTEKRTVASI